MTSTRASSERNGGARLSPKATITLGMAGALLVATATVVIWFSDKLSSMQIETAQTIAKVPYELRELRRSIDANTDNLRRIGVDAVTVKELAQWIRLLKAQNPELDVPEFDN